jgi:hypothetical protein
MLDPNLFRHANETSRGSLSDPRLVVLSALVSEG